MISPEQLQTALTAMAETYEDLPMLLPQRSLRTPENVAMLMLGTALQALGLVTLEQVVKNGTVQG